MTDLPALSSLGRRIMIVGPTNAGKSTLAVAIGAKIGATAFHVDLFRHTPNTDWFQRPDTEFHALHAAALTEEDWVMDGNYSVIMPERIARATGVIALDEPLWRRYWRYFTRTLGRRRVGALEGNKDSIKWDMIHWLWISRHAAVEYTKMARKTGLPVVVCRNQRELNALYQSWGLTFPIES